MVQQLLDQHQQHLRQGLQVLAELTRRHLGHGALAQELKELGQTLPPPTRWPPPPHPTAAPDCLSALSNAVKTLHHLKGGQPPTPEEERWIFRTEKALTLVGRLLRRQELATRLRGLYVIADPQAAQGRDLVQVVKAALRGGARAIQLRDKERDKGDQLPLALELADLCRQHGALFIVNNHADLAVACDADGVHVGQRDLSVPHVREVLRPSQLVGRSNARLEEALESREQGADYIAVGSMFPTTTKAGTPPAGVETLRRVREAIDLPLVAIGGINESNVAQVVQAGADAVCVTAAVMGAHDPQATAHRLVTLIQRAQPAARGT